MITIQGVDFSFDKRTLELSVADNANVIKVKSGLISFVVTMESCLNGYLEMLGMPYSNKPWTFNTMSSAGWANASTRSSLQACYLRPKDTVVVYFDLVQKRLQKDCSDYSLGINSFRGVKISLALTDAQEIADLTNLLKEIKSFLTTT